MIKKNKVKLIISSIVILLPAIFGLIAWDRLPVQFASHWGADAKVSGFGSPAAFVLILPLILLAIDWLAILVSLRDPKFKDQSQKVFNLVIWIVPVISVFANGIVYLSVFGYSFNAMMLIPLFMGFGFIVMGNYMPKCKQNYMFGIRIKTTLTSEANWIATHRLAGKMWVMGGIVALFLVFLPPVPMGIAFLAVTMTVTLVPIIYSYAYYKKYGAEKDMSEYREEQRKIAKKIAIPLIIILAFVPMLMFTGKVTVEFEDTAFKADSSYCSPLSVEYGSVVGIQLRDDFERGSRINGIGSLKLCAGLFRNDEFGQYTLYSYTSNDTAIVVTTTSGVLVINMEDNEKTEELYGQLKEKCK